MSNLKEIRTRIASIRSTRKITSAMKMVSASRLRKVQNYIVHLRQYAILLRGILDEVTAQLSASRKGIYLSSKSTGDALVICIGSSRGLCGTYNGVLVRQCLKRVKELSEGGLRVQLLVLGKKPASFFKKRGFSMLEADHDLIDKVNYGSASEFAHHLMELFLKENFESIEVVYYRFRNAVVQELTVEQLLPLPGDEGYGGEQADEVSDEDPVIMEPSLEDAAGYMIAQFVSYNVYRILLDASASEHGSRMTAMHQATDNADEMIRTLTLHYNKARQASVTRELMDIVGGNNSSYSF